MIHSSDFIVLLYELSNFSSFYSQAVALSRGFLKKVPRQKLRELLFPDAALPEVAAEWQRPL
jgi:hypothetical protein